MRIINQSIKCNESFIAINAISFIFQIIGPHLMNRCNEAKRLIGSKNKLSYVTSCVLYKKKEKAN